MVVAAADNDHMRPRPSRRRLVALLVAAAVAQTPRLCDLGAPSQVIGSGRLDGVSWRIVVTPPRPWGVYYAAGFGPVLRGGVTGKIGNCSIDIYAGSPGYSCGEWQVAGLAGQFVDGEWGGRTIVDGYECLDAPAAYFVMVPADGPEVKVVAVHYLGLSFAAFALPASSGKPAVMTAYAASGRPVATTTSF